MTRTELTVAVDKMWRNPVERVRFNEWMSDHPNLDGVDTFYLNVMFTRWAAYEIGKTEGCLTGLA